MYGTRGRRTSNTIRKSGTSSSPPETAKRLEETMILSDMSARQLYLAMEPRKRFGFGKRAALVNVDPQRAYTDVAAFPATAYETDPNQCAHMNALAAACRALLNLILHPARLFLCSLGLRGFSCQVLPPTVSRV